MTDPAQTTRRIYEFFAEICRIPHPSFHCDQIRAFLKKTALTYNLEYRQDIAGNVRLDRRKADYSKAIILQSHMDMVPQSTDPDFDFTTQGIEFEEINGLLRSKDCKTTLGADNGIGMAASLTAITDADMMDEPLAALFTVDEETNMYGAHNIAPELLEGSAIFNLDSELFGELIIGCAGGCNLNVFLPVKAMTVPEKYTGVKVKISGLKGGHSGTDIDQNRGNSILMMLDFISRSQMQINELKGGNLSNAIPRSAEFTGVVADFDDFEKFAADYAAMVRETFDTDENFAITVTELDKTPTRCIENFAALAAYISNNTYGVAAFDEKLKCVATSSNFAIINGNVNSLDILISIRSLFAAEGQKLADKLAEHFINIGGTANINEKYPPWESTTSADFLQKTNEIFKSLFHTECDIKCIHAGLECGLFQSKNSSIPIISFGPTIRNPHSPSEELELASLKDFYKFLYTMVKNVLKK